MDDNATRALAFAVDRGLAPPPGDGGIYACLNATPQMPEAWKAHLLCEQGFRPAFLDLRSAGFEVVPLLQKPASPFGGAIVIAGRRRAANEQAIARALELVAPGSPVLIAGANTDGVQSLRKWASRHLAIGDSLSKHHAAAFVVTRPAENPFVALASGEPVSPAQFSAGEADAGSLLLAGHFDARIHGAVADFGAGSGLLSRELLARGGEIARLDLYEADYLSLERARAALAGTAIPLGFHWHDLLREPVATRYDVIVMNPPFHAGRAADPGIGLGFIEAAARALAPAGRLMMVANRNLPYEAGLAANFRSVARLAETAAFKVFEATR